ncbi:MAG: hypothetical protein ABI083_13315 [Lapillicoccus sp.]
MTRRRLGSAAVRQLATSPSLETAVATLARSTYGHDVHPGQTLPEAQRAVVETVVWNMRVLGGWVPRDGVPVLRILLGTLEATNVQDHLQRLAGTDPPPPYRLGALATVWPRLSRTPSVPELRKVLTTSPWGDPGGDSARVIGLSMQTSLADRIMSAVPEAEAWTAAAMALLVAREVLLGGRDLPANARNLVARVLGPSAASAVTLPDLMAVLPGKARWVLSDVQDPLDLWRAEARWWARVERDGFALVRAASAGRAVVVGVVAIMATDAWRVRGALELAARGGTPLEVFDGIA